jgi:hypothetical protein
VRSKLLHVENVSGATVTVLGSGPTAATVTAPTNAHGVATLNLTALPAGTYTLRVTPAQTTSDPVGPDIATTAPVPARIFRSLEATATVDAGRIKAASVLLAQRSNGTVSVGKDP